jgi:ribonuclease HII
MRPRAPRLRRDGGLYAYERALARRGLAPVAGADEAGRGACAGPLVVAAVILPSGRRGVVPGLADSKLLTPDAREEVYAEVIDRATAWSVISLPPGEVDRRGLHRTNLVGMRRALARLEIRPQYALTDGFPVGGLGVPGLAVPKGDRVVACIAAASVVAKVTRDRIMVGMHERFPVYDFAAHKGYVTPGHTAALTEYGPCPEHRYSFVNVALRAGARAAEEIEELDVVGRQIDGVEEGRGHGDGYDEVPVNEVAAFVGDQAVRVP